MNKGFTLVELAIVIVIIGLLVGGILQGKELIQQSKISSTILQINQFKVAIDTFKAKYNYLPGDIPEPHATNYGFQTRGTFAGQGDGSGYLHGVWGNGAGNSGPYQNQGENCMVWVDLSFVKLIKGTFDACRTNTNYVTYTDNITNLNRYVPQANIGESNHFFIWTSGQSNIAGTWLTMQKGTATSGTSPAPGLSVIEAYSFDKKLDDGVPMTGSVNTIYFPTSNCCNPWWAGTVTSGYFSGATPSSAASCMDNNNVAGVVLQYSTATNADAINCALSFKMF